MKQLANFVMDRLAANDLSDWSLAMHREYDELETGHLGWAAGCAAVTFRRKLPSTFGLLALLLLTHVLGPLFAAWMSGAAFALGAKWSAYPIAFGYAVPWAFLLGIYRPNSVVAVTAIGGLLLPTLLNYSASSFVLDMRFMNHVVGAGAIMLISLNGKGTIWMISLWLVSAATGAHVARKHLSK